MRDKRYKATVSTDHNFSRERRAEADSNRGHYAYRPNALPLGQAGSPRGGGKGRWDLIVEGKEVRRQEGCALVGGYNVSLCHLINFYICT